MYFYEHKDGSIIRKPDIVVDTAGGPNEYFTGPNVTRWWHEKDTPEKHDDEGCLSCQ